MVQVHHHTPKQVIVDTSDLVEFFADQTDHLIYGYNLREIVAQIMTIITNLNDIDEKPNFTALPHTDRLIMNQIPLELETIKGAVWILADALLARLKEQGMFDPETRVMRYIFSKFIGNDLILDHFPF